jgi:hypothetical protein
MNSIVIDLSASGWCNDIREVFRHSPTAFSDFLQRPVETLGELGFDDTVSLSDGATARVSSILTSLNPLELNQVIGAVRPLTYRAGDGGGGDGGDGGSCTSDSGTTGDCSDTGDNGDSAGIASAVAVASNVAVVGEVAVAIAAVAIAVYGGAVESNTGLTLSPLMGVELSPDFESSEAYLHLAAGGLSDSRKRALIKQRLIEANAGEGRVEAEVLGKRAWFDVAYQGPIAQVTAGGLL